MIGKSLAHYRVTEKLGEGGMGEVWRAGDSKLGRDVALKMVSAPFAQDAERMARFQREAQLLARLNHPNIASIYGLEEADGMRFLVLELVEGPTLLDRLRAGRIPTREALEMAHQIAEALEFAHESGVVHRDLKPANVKVTDDGRVKVLDFGLAKALDPESGTSHPSGPLESPTRYPTLSSPVTGALTGANAILGTAAYMSPEQARGQAVDRRADIWAFGVILYEMLTGRRLFDGETASDMLAAVLRKELEWDALPEDTPPQVRRLLRRCLVRKPKERLRDIGDARLMLGEVLSGAADEDSSGQPRDAAASARWLWLLPVVALAAAAITFALTRLAPTPEPNRALRKYAMPFPRGARVTSAAIAPDGSAIAFALDGALHVRDLTTLEERRIEDLTNISPPFWSPDGQWMACGAGTSLWKVRRSGGKPVRVAPSPDSGFQDLSSGAWREDGTIFFTTGTGQLYSVSAQGGDPQVAIACLETEKDFHEMADLGGRALALVIHGENTYDTIGRANAKGERGQAIYSGDRVYTPAWSPTGHVLFARRGNAAGVWAVPFSLDAMETQGSAFLVAQGAGSPSVASNGTLAYVRGASTQETVLTLVARNGDILETIGEPARFHPYPSLSPDGKTIAIRIREGETDNIWMIDVERGTRQRFSQGPGSHSWGSWDRTMENFWFFNESWSAPEVFVKPASGTGERRKVAEGHVPMVSSDGRWLVYMRPAPERDDEDRMDLWILDLSDDDAEPRPFVEDAGRQWIFDISPTDNLIAYSTHVSGSWQVHLTTYPERSGDWPVSTRGGWWPQWRADGRELFYAVGDSIVSVQVDVTDGKPRLSLPELLFRRPRYSSDSGGFPNGFEVMPDGQTFVFNMWPEEQWDEPAALVVVHNWIREFE